MYYSSAFVFLGGNKLDFITLNILSYTIYIDIYTLYKIYEWRRKYDGIEHGTFLDDGRIGWEREPLLSSWRQ